MDSSLDGGGGASGGSGGAATANANAAAATGVGAGHHRGKQNSVTFVSFVLSRFPVAIDVVALLLLLLICLSSV